MSSKEEQAVREYLTGTVTGPVSDCEEGTLARALLAMVEKGNERFGKWRIHRNDSPELGQEMWQEVITAMHRAIFGEGK